MTCLKLFIHHLLLFAYIYKIFTELQLDHPDYATGYIETIQKLSEFW